jgi:hypothetical protein
MNRHLLTPILALAIVLVPFGPAGHAQQLNHPAETTAKAEIEKRLSKKETRVKVKLRNRSELKGRIAGTSENGFTLADEKAGNRTDIAYADVLNVEGRGMSKTKKVLITTGVGVGVIIAVAAYAITHFWD